MLTKNQILSFVPKSKKVSVYDAWEDDDGIWIMLNDGWNADNMDSNCKTIHCGGEDEDFAETMKELKYQIRGISRRS